MTAPLSTSPIGTTFYIDGFNLYYGAVAQTPYRWLNLQKLCQLLRPQETIRKIWYFTALISGPTRPNQENYLEALSSCPLVTPVFGNFKRKKIECHNTECPGTGRRYFKTYEEKRTDVNIAIQMLDDAYRNSCDRMVLISGDSDMVPAIDLVAARFPAIKVHVYIPVPANNPTGSKERSFKNELRSVATTVRELPNQLLPHSQFADSLTTQFGVLTRPSAWHAPKGPKPPRLPRPIPAGSCEWCGKP